MSLPSIHSFAQALKVKQSQLHCPITKLILFAVALLVAFALRPSIGIYTIAGHACTPNQVESIGLQHIFHGRTTSQRLSACLQRLPGRTVEQLERPWICRI